MKGALSWFTALMVRAARGSIAAAGLWWLASTCAVTAAEIDPDQELRLKRGEVVATVGRASNGDGAHVLAVVDIARSPSDVWPIMIDCARAPRFVPDLLSCKVLERDPSGAWDIREHVSSPGWLLPNVRTVFRSEYEPIRRIRFSRVAGDLDRSEGEWLLTAIDGGRSTRVTYTTDVAYSSWIPDAWMRDHLTDEIPKVLTALRQECMGAK